jgi:predicted HTH transcriptional regulator
LGYARWENFIVAVHRAVDSCKTQEMKLQESQTVEFKESWRDEYLKTVCAFANTDGGVLYIGVNDKCEVVGVKMHKS